METPKTLWLKKHMNEAKFKECMLFEYVCLHGTTAHSPASQTT